MKKKKRFLVIFPTVGNKGKKIFIMKNEKKRVQIWNGLLPNCIAKGKEIVLQYSHCIAEKKA